MGGAEGLRIAHVAPVFPPYRGGMGTVAFHQAAALAQLGVQVTVFTPRAEAGPRQSPPGVEVVELAPIARFGNAACLPQVLTKGRDFDIIHVHYPFFGTAELLAGYRTLGGPPLIVQYQMDVVGDGWKAAIFAGHKLLMFPMVLRAADRILVTSVDYAESSAFLAGRMPSLDDRIEVLPAGVDTVHFHPQDPAAARKRLGLPAAAKIVFFLSRLDKAHYFKGLPILVRALGRLPEVTLVVGGDGELRRRHERNASKHLGERAIFVGDIAEADLPSYFAAADVVVLPSVDRTEAFGLVLLEAMACGTPVVASRLNGVQTLVEDGNSGYLVTPGNEVELAESIATTINDRQRMAAHALRVASKFRWQDIAEKLKAIYEEVSAETEAGADGQD